MCTLPVRRIVRVYDGVWLPVPAPSQSADDGVVTTPYTGKFPLPGARPLLARDRCVAPKKTLRRIYWHVVVRGRLTVM